MNPRRALRLASDCVREVRHTYAFTANAAKREDEPGASAKHAMMRYEELTMAGAWLDAMAARLSGRWYQGKFGPFPVSDGSPMPVRPGRKAPAGSDEASAFGFTAELFAGWLWLDEDGAVYVSFVHSLRPREGNLSRVFAAVLAAGRVLKVPCPMPFGGMQAVVERKGLVPTLEHDDLTGEDVDVWVMRPGGGDDAVPS